MSFPVTSPPLARALAERNYDNPTPVQLAVLADDAVDRDLLVSAQTGSGKTVAYGLAMAANLLGDAERFGPAAAPLALIVAPTRELALQVQRELAWLYQHAGARVVSCVGGMDPRREQRELEAGAHIVVGTPGRLCDHLRRGRLDISELKAVVLDEADEMLNLGFREDMEFILETTPETRRTLLFSATFPRGIVALAKQYQDDAFRIEVEGDEGGHADIEYRAIRIAPGDAEHAVVNLLRFYEAPSAIVFCNTREAVRHLQAALLERGFSVVALSGELTQNERTMALQSLRDGRSRVCVATDVAARGIDLANLDLVVHAELPNDPEVMQHRSGRTGRAGRKGVSVLLVPPARRRRAEMLLNLAGIEAVWGRRRRPTRSASSIRSECCRIPSSPRRPRRRIRRSRRLCWPSARPRTSPPRWSGCIAPGCHRRRTFSIPARIAAGRATSAVARALRAAKSARRRRERRPASRPRATAWASPASGFAPRSDAARRRRRAGCCR
ncbi:fragment of putative DEAD-box cold-shock protein, ATP-independent RNA helicase (part 1) [Bradyrhizobium sp. ORS 375]|nr:fragment of putative DEAD-box cold-shock protein, ATP-independent RNA helicase (part 1) [Bradyrhizobium sp. ORS 375]